MKESVTYSKLRPELAKFFQIDRVENAIQPGMPDVVLSAFNRTMFVEMKAEIGKSLRGSQVSWCFRRVTKGCTNDMFVIARDMEQYVIFYMVDVANNAGEVSLDLYHVVKQTPEEVAAYFRMVLFGGQNES